MRILLAYISLVLLWSTTPLAVKWSGEGVGYLFGASARMVIGLTICLLLLFFGRQALSLQRKALWTYVAVFVQLFASMLIVNWAAQFIPSGWISVIFGLVPLCTAIIAAIYLKERSLTWAKLASYGLGLGGLVLVFGSALQLGQAAVLAISSLLLAVWLQAASAVWVKQINAQIPALVQVTGGLCLAVPAYLTLWYFLDGQWPIDIPLRSLCAILYLGGIATAFGFGLYYFILQRLPTTRVALISLMSPVLALIIGHLLNHEPLTLKIALGVALVVLSLLVHQLAERKLVKLN